MEKISVLVAGMAGASLGTEVIKSLRLKQEKYRVFGCDISPYAYGHYIGGMEKTFQISRDHYVENIISICNKYKISVVVPGGDEPAVLLGHSRKDLEEANILFAGNTAPVVDLCSHKGKLFDYLSKYDIVIPQSWTINTLDDIKNVSYPCIIKPATNSGGSTSVFIANKYDELLTYAVYMLNNQMIPIVQEYLPHETGEYTVGVLHSPDGTLLASLCLKRLFHAKLSVMSNSMVSEKIIADYKAERENN